MQVTEEIIDKYILGATKAMGSVEELITVKQYVRAGLEAALAAVPQEPVVVPDDLLDKIDGLESALHSAIEVAFKRGATEWVRMNYPKHYATLAASPPHPSPSLAAHPGRA